MDDPRSPGGVNGLQTGDLIVKVNEAIADFPALPKVLVGNQPLEIEYEREKELMTTRIGKFSMETCWGC